MTPEQVEALRYYITAAVLFLTRDIRDKHGDLEAARLNLERAFDRKLDETPPTSFTDLIL